MHIAYLDPHAVPDSCPEALQILYTVDALGELGVRVTLVTPKPAGAIAARDESGGLIGNYMDRQAQELEKVADTQRAGDGIIVTMRDKILFDVDSATVKPAAMVSLDKISAVLTKYPKTTITVAGHTDNTGRADYNLKLSERRANAVRFALAERGVGASRVTAMGFGADNPVASNTTPEGRAENRRVELHIVPNDELRKEDAASPGG